MVLEKVHCPYCGSNPVGRYGYSKDGTKRYICHTYQPEIKGQIIEMTLNVSGISTQAELI